jgi:integrase
MKLAAALTPKIIDSENIPAKGKSKKLADGGGLHLLIKDSGRKYWRLKFRLFGEEKTLSIGAYPLIGVEAARLAARDARKLINKGISPTELQREEKTKAYVAGVLTFGAVGREFLNLKLGSKAPATRRKLEWQYECCAPLYQHPIASVTSRQVIAVLKGIEAKGHREAAHRVGQFASRVFRFAVQNSYCTVNPVADLREVLEARQVTSHAGITDPQKFGFLMRLIDDDSFAGFANTRHGLQLLARTFVRPGELRQALWSEFNFDKAEWRIPAARMKMRREHLVPLSTQALAIVRAQFKLTGKGPLVFPGLRSGRPMSDNTMNMALKSFYLATEHTPHGFRVSASTILHEAGEDPAVIELQLSHAKRDKIAGIYDRSQRVPERRQLMQDWSDLIDKFKSDLRPV